MGRYYDRYGIPIDLQTWAELLHQQGYDRLASTRFKLGTHEIHVSTVWLGLDHSFNGGPPLIFETMIFGGEHDQYQERYSTEEEALAGHKEACRLVRQALKVLVEDKKPPAFPVDMRVLLNRQQLPLTEEGQTQADKAAAED